MKKAFIAAPLIGTVIFLVAIFFAVNLSKTESSAVSEIASNAYHSRLVSLMELYRSDLKSVFKTGISNSVESVISKQCWNYPLTLQYDINSNGLHEPNTLSANGLGFFPSNYVFKDEVEKRLDYCFRLKKTVGGLVQSSGRGSELKQWLANLNNSITFEGITFELSSPSKFEEFRKKLNSYPFWSPNGKPPACVISSSSSLSNEPAPNCPNLGSGPNQCNDDETRKVCSNGTEVEQLIGKGLFDCFSFALKADPTENINSFSCCTPEGSRAQESYYNNIQDGTEHFNGKQSVIDNECVPGNGKNNYLAGCEGGQFYYQLNVKSPEIYPLLPRIKANDGKGNIIRSGGLADENEYLLIRYPFFKYYDLSLKFARIIAFGISNKDRIDFTNFTEHNRTNLDSNNLYGNEGFISGLCLTNDSVDPRTTLCPFNYRRRFLSSDIANYQSMIVNSLKKLYLSANDSISQSNPGFNIKFSETDNREFGINDPEMITLFNKFINPLAITEVNSRVIATQLVSSAKHYVRIEDFNSNVQIVPGVPNTFCIALDLSLT